jgi:ABC-type hemin transport system ATPase subunit
MKARLLHRDRDFDWLWSLEAAAVRAATRTGRRHYRDKERPFDPNSGLPWHADALTADLALTTLFEAMALGDDCIYEVSRKVILTAVTGDLETIRYRQDVLQDCLDKPQVVRALYAIAGDALEKQIGHHLGVLASHPDWVLGRAIERLSVFIEFLKKLRSLANAHAHEFRSEGWAEFFAIVTRDLDDNYLAYVRAHLEDLKFRHGTLLGAQLGKANKGRDYVLHRAPHRPWWSWLMRFFHDKASLYAFELSPRDEAGAQALRTLRNRGIALAANALGQSADHVSAFFGMLRAELAFYVGCINLHEELARKGGPACVPSFAPVDERKLSCRGLHDVGLLLAADRRVVGNDVHADGKDLMIVTGPNNGGKSTFLRSVGLAQLMMQSGMFVSAESFSASLCDGLFTHYRREEDVRMESGKLDEELGRMSAIIDHIARRSMILFNEPFAATNEREGSEIAQQIISALLDRGVQVMCVTHMYELAHGFHQRNRGNALFLRAGRQSDGSRTFKMMEGEPLPTSYGADLYDTIFGAPEGQPETKGTPRASGRPKQDGSAEGRARAVTDACHLGEGHRPRY